MTKASFILTLVLSATQAAAEIANSEYQPPERFNSYIQACMDLNKEVKASPPKLTGTQRRAILALAQTCGKDRSGAEISNHFLNSDSVQVDPELKPQLISMLGFPTYLVPKLDLDRRTGPSDQAIIDIMNEDIGRGGPGGMGGNGSRRVPRHPGAP